MVYYKEGLGFFVEGVSSTIPEDAIKITQECYVKALEAQSNGDTFSICKKGKLYIDKNKYVPSPREGFEIKGHLIDLDVGTIAYILSPSPTLTIHVGSGKYVKVSGKEREALREQVLEIEEQMFKTK